MKLESFTCSVRHKNPVSEFQFDIGFNIKSVLLLILPTFFLFPQQFFLHFTKWNRFGLFYSVLCMLYWLVSVAKLKRFNCSLPIEQARISFLVHSSLVVSSSKKGTVLKCVICHWPFLFLFLLLLASHVTWVLRFLDELTSRGHTVTFVTVVRNQNIWYIRRILIVVLFFFLYILNRTKISNMQVFILAWKRCLLALQHSIARRSWQKWALILVFWIYYLLSSNLWSQLGIKVSESE